MDRGIGSAKVVILLILLVGVSLGRTRIPKPGQKIWDCKVMAVNDLWLWNSNFGEFGQKDNPEGPGGEWPGGSGHMYLFGGGIWVGCLVDTSSDFDTLVSVGYNPNTGSGEMVPGLISMGSNAYTDPDVRIYEYPGDWPPPINVFPMTPQKNISHGDQWCCFNDGDPAFHVPNDTRPIGIEIYMSVYGWNYYLYRDFIFYRWVIKNCSGDSIHDMHFTICIDPDIGDASDDILGFFVDTTFVETTGGQVFTYHIDDICFCYDFDGQEPGWDSVGCSAFDLLQGPYALSDGEDNDRVNDSILYGPQYVIVDSMEVDSIWFKSHLPKSLWDGDGDGLFAWEDPSEIEDKGMTALIGMTLEVDPSFDYQRYLVMKGIDYRTGESLGYWVGPQWQPDDRRLTQSSGPISFAAEDSVVLVLAVICSGFSHPGGGGADTMHLVRKDYLAQFIYDMNWIVPGSPPSPCVSAIPGDHMITLIWDDVPEYTPDPYFQYVSNPNSPLYDTMYVEFDFQGYKIYKSMTGLPSDWILLDQCDLVDTVDSTVLIDTVNQESVRTLPLNSGLFHSYVDNSARNGFTYYYAVTSYDFNALVRIGSTKPWFSLESGKETVAAAPRREAANYVPPACSIVKIDIPEHSAHSLDIKIPIPMDVEENLYSLKFYKPTCDTLPNSYTPVYWYELTCNGKEIRPKTGLLLDFGDSTRIGFPIVDGVEISLWVNLSEFFNDYAFEQFESVSGNYPVESLTPYRTLTIHRNRWAFTGADYKVKWQLTGNGMTAKVTDLNTNEEILYKPFNPLNDSLKQDGWSWCFLDRMNAAGVPNQYLADSIQAYFHITGGFFSFLPSRMPLPARLFPHDGDEWIVYSKKVGVVPYDCEYQIFSTPARFLRDTTLSLNVKVVPNPYILENEWQQSQFQRKLKFINLPDRCKIRIFTVAGDLIKTINHDNTYKAKNDAGGDEWWDVVTCHSQVPASGVYLFHVDSDVGEQVGKFVLILGRYR